MSISAILSTNTNQISISQSANQQQRAAFQKLTQALQSGDLAGTSQASPVPSESSSLASVQSAQLSKEFNALRTALQSGGQVSASNAYKTAQHNAAPGVALGRIAHHHHGRRGSQGLTSRVSASDAADANAAELSNVFQSVNLTA